MRTARGAASPANATLLRLKHHCCQNTSLLAPRSLPAYNYNMKAQGKHQRGFVLILVLAVAALLAVLIGTLSFTSRAELVATGSLRREKTIHYLTEGGADVALAAAVQQLKQDSEAGPYDHPSEAWAAPQELEIPPSVQSTEFPYLLKVRYYLEDERAKLDVNLAGVEQLEALPGLSRRDAELIIARRPYKYLRELEGLLHPETYETTRPFLTAAGHPGGVCAINVNTASREVLAAALRGVPGFDEKRAATAADAICRHRKPDDPFDGRSRALWYGGGAKAELAAVLDGVSAQVGKSNIQRILLMTAPEVRGAGSDTDDLVSEETFYTRFVFGSDAFTVVTSSAVVQVGQSDEELVWRVEPYVARR